MQETLRRKIVFVVGAGASADFGFPTGGGLADQIRNKLDIEFREGSPGNGPIKAALERLGFDDDYKDATRQLRAGIGPGESIDQFLFRRRASPKVRALGMMTLADVILEAERLSPLARFKLDNFESNLNAQRTTVNSWPAVLLDLLVGVLSPDEINKNIFGDIGFAIFNYDRCVEQSLFFHLLVRHNLPEYKVREIIRSIPMLHIYGVLGDPWESSLPFGMANAPLETVSERLRTYHDDLDDEKHKLEIRELMDHAEKVVFLGFGFHPNNVQLLYPEFAFGSRQLLGTAQGCGGSETFSRVKSSVGSKFEDANCTAFLRTFGQEILRKPWKLP